MGLHTRVPDADDVSYRQSCERITGTRRRSRFCRDAVRADELTVNKDERIKFGHHPLGQRGTIPRLISWRPRTYRGSLSFVRWSYNKAFLLVAALSGYRQRSRGVECS